MRTTEKFDALAEGYSEHAYADPVRFHGRRAHLVETLGPALQSGDSVLDLACGDAGIARHLLSRGIGYVGIDASPSMVKSARRRIGPRGHVELGDMNSYRPAQPVDTTLCFRAMYYAGDRRGFLELVAEYTEKKFVFDLNPRRFALEPLRWDLQRAGFDRVVQRAFFVPQTYVLPRPAAAILEAAEQIGPLARILLGFRFTYICAAFRS